MARRYTRRPEVSPSLIETIIVDALGGLVSLLGWGLVWLWRKLTGASAPAQDAAPNWSRWLYAKEHPLTVRERGFYRLLQKWAWERDYDVLANVNLYAVIGCREKFGRGLTAWRKIMAKQIDFVVVNAAGETVVCVELDDGSHDKPGNRERDADKDAAFKAAGMRLVRTREAGRLPENLSKPAKT